MYMHFLIENSIRCGIFVLLCVGVVVLGLNLTSLLFHSHNLTVNSYPMLIGDQTILAVDKHRNLCTCTQLYKRSIIRYLRVSSSVMVLSGKSKMIGCIQRSLIAFHTTQTLNGFSFSTVCSI